MARTQTPPDTDESANGRVGFADDSSVHPDIADQEIESDNLVNRTRDIIARTPNEQITLKLYRLKDDGSRIFCANYSPEKFASGDLEMIRAEWGAGKFELRMIGPKGLKDRPREFEIAERVGASTPSIANNQPQQNTELLAVLRMMADSQAAILRAVSDKPAQVDSLEQFKQFASIMRDMAPAANPIAAQPPQSASSMLADLMGAMKALKEVAAETAPPAPSEDPMAMLPSILGIVKEAMGARSNGGNSANVGFPMIETPASVMQHTTAETSTDQPTTESDGQMNITAALVMRGTLQKLIGMAVKGDTPENGGLFIYEKLPDEFLQYLDLPNWFEIIESFEPAVTPHRAWIEKAKSFADIEFAKTDADSESDDPSQG